MAIRIEKRMTLLLDEQTHAQLKELAHREQISQCAIIRQLITYRAQMEIHLQPTCANGHRCSCPQMHGVAPVIHNLNNDLINRKQI